MQPAPPQFTPPRSPAGPAAEELMAALYGELRSLAAYYLAGRGVGHTLQPTALVHEAYLRLLSKGTGAWNDRTHFFSVAAMAMRQILLNHAEAKRSLKRGEGFQRMSLTEAFASDTDREVDIVEMNDLLATLEQLDPRQARIVELRYFGGLSVEEIAPILEVSVSTVEKDWRMARLWLLSKLKHE
ncbi:MAG: sigma-70 family RNA polymerase sigma factor [Phycisphaerae bacterium]|nr:sigma-70 family RNA polymerase sigma factor [Phycisphaerae bacterium]